MTSECGEWRSRRSTGTIHAHHSSLSEQNARVESNQCDEKSENADLVYQTCFSLDPILSLDVHYTLWCGRRWKAEFPRGEPFSSLNGLLPRKILCLLSEINPEVLPMLDAPGNTSFLSGSAHRGWQVLTSGRVSNPRWLENDDLGSRIQDMHEHLPSREDILPDSEDFRLSRLLHVA